MQPNYINVPQFVWYRWGSGTITSLLCTWGVGAKSASVCIVQVRYSFGITVQYRQIGEEDSLALSLCVQVFVCTNVCACVYYCLAHVHAYTTDHTNHTTHTLRFLDSGVFLPGSIWSAESTATSQSSQISRSGLLNLSQSLQDLLKHCWVPLGGWGQKGGAWEMCRHIQMCVYTCKRNTILRVPCICRVTMWPHLRPALPQIFPPSPLCTWVCVWGEKGHRWWNTYIIYTVLWL